MILALRTGKVYRDFGGRKRFGERKNERTDCRSVKNNPSFLSRDFYVFFQNIVHKEIFLPFGTRFGVVAEQDVVESETQQFLRSQQRHSGLFGRPVSFALVAFDAGGDQIVRRRFAALRPRQDMIERQVFGVFVFAAVLAAVAVANINPRPFHRRFLAAAFDVHVGPQTHDRRDGKRRRRRMQNVFAVVFLDRQFTRKPHTNRPRDTDRAQRFIRKIQKQNSTRYQWNHLLKLLDYLMNSNTKRMQIAISCVSL